MSVFFRANGIASKLVNGRLAFEACDHPVKQKIESKFIYESNSETSTNPGWKFSRLAANTPTFFSVFSKNMSMTAQRFFHSDIRFPKLDEARRKDTTDPKTPARQTEDIRRATPTSILYALGGALGLMAAKEGVEDVIRYKWIPADQQALASVEIDLNEIPEGQVKTYEWRGKPVFVSHRTTEMVARERSVAVNELRDPQKDEDRVQKDEWLILIGVCTHLGCVPIPNQGEYHGYFCPCHGSHYDGSGRVRKGPAPLNLEVPNYAFNGDKVIVGGN